MKHDDRAGFRIDSLEIDHHGYMPYVGIFGGDDTSFEVCLSCGHCQKWKVVTEQDVKQDEELGKHINCPTCKQPWREHDFGVPEPSCP
jgi:hypothetical protein